jgi:hypothetical protein
MISAPRGSALRAAKYVAIAALVFYAAKRLLDVWRDARANGVGPSVDVHWYWIAWSWVIVLVSYAVLIETWRRMLAAWGDRVPFIDAARIWFVSNLARNLPGKVWSIPWMAMMSRQANVSPAASIGAAVLSTAVNIATGLMIGVSFGWSLLEGGSASGGMAAAATLAVAIVGIAVTPLLLPHVVSLASRVSGRELSLPPLPRRAIVIAFVGNIIAWVLYGLAFRTFVLGVSGSAPAGAAPYTVAWASSYVAGYLAFLAPGGLVVRETALAEMLEHLKLVGNEPQALMLSWTSRLWLTVPEVVPGLILLAFRPRPRTNDSASDTAAGSSAKAP